MSYTQLEQHSMTICSSYLNVQWLCNCTRLYLCAKLKKKLIKAIVWLSTGLRLTLKRKQKKKRWKSRLNFVIRPSSLLLRAATGSKQRGAGASREGIPLWSADSALSVLLKRLTFHLSQNPGFTSASARRWLTIITPWENWTEGGIRETELLPLPRVFCSVGLYSLVLAITHLKFSAAHPNLREQPNKMSFLWSFWPNDQRSLFYHILNPQQFLINPQCIYFNRWR